MQTQTQIDQMEQEMNDMVRAEEQHEDERVAVYKAHRDAPVTESWYEKARKRVMSNAILYPYRSVLLARGNDEHYRRVATETASKLAKWASDTNFRRTY